MDIAYVICCQTNINLVINDIAQSGLGINQATHIVNNWYKIYSEFIYSKKDGNLLMSYNRTQGYWNAEIQLRKYLI